MNKHEDKVTERKQRMRRLLNCLKKLFPETRTHLNYRNPFELLIAVILSAQCTDVMVNKVTAVLFEHYSDPESLAQAPRGTLEKIIFKTGFYRAKARHIKGCAQKIVDRFEGIVPANLDALMTLPGVGRKTANVVLGNAFEIRAGIAVDTHVRRFAIKFDLTDHTYPEKIEADLKKIIPKKDWTSAAYYMICYGREICPARRHNCADHPCTRIYPLAAEHWPKSRF
jgi:endonuclease III